MTCATLCGVYTGLLRSFLAATDPITLKDVAIYESAIPRVSAALSEWLEHATYDPLREISWLRWHEQRAESSLYLSERRIEQPRRRTRTIEVMSTTHRTVVAATLLLWVAVAVLLASWRVHSVLSGPRDGETYAYTVSFQLFAFAYAELPWLLLLLCFVLGCELVVWRRQSQRRPNY